MEEGRNFSRVERGGVEVRCRGWLLVVWGSSLSVWPGAEKMIFGGGTVSRGQGEGLD